MLYTFRCSRTCGIYVRKSEIYRSEEECNDTCPMCGAASYRLGLAAEAEREIAQ